MTNALNRIPSLDGLRAISILFVLWGHLCGTGNFPIQETDTFNLANLGVRMFFVISGFLITGILINELNKTSSINLKKFYFRRTLRIFPPYYFFLFTIGIIGLWGGLSVSLHDWLSSVLYISNFTPIKTWELGHTWSLAVEEQFYLIMPFLLFAIRKKNVLIVLCLVILIAPLVRFATILFASDIDARWVAFGFQANADSLAFGCVLALLKGKLGVNSLYQKFLGSRMFLFVPVIGLSLNLLSDRPRIYFLFAITIINLCLVLCLDWAVTFNESIIGRFLNLRSFAYLGTLSYSIYLWQQPFLNRNSDAFYTNFPLNIVFLMICALISFYVIEKPSLRLRARLEKK